MNHGRVEQIGTAENLSSSSHHLVWQLLGSVNLFHGRVEGDAVRVGTDVIRNQSNDLTQGAQVLAFRPHELEIIVLRTPLMARPKERLKGYMQNHPHPVIFRQF